ncbi:MAG: hypothetical protein JWO59_1521, partial [Chloroflexi bacterium]|nr:hypothetical protein [Chloroflexota bacterium]
LFLESIEKVSDRFDAIIVDEGQDFLQLWWDTILRLLADPDSGILYIFYDDCQRIFPVKAGYPDRYPIDGQPFLLQANCRTTQAIHNYALRFFPDEDIPRCKGIEGRAPEIVRVQGGQEIRALRETIDRLLGRGVKLSDILILSVRRGKAAREKSPWIREDTRVGNAKLTWGGGGPDKIVCRSIYKVKGLESDVVILVDSEQAERNYGTAVLYTAALRARHHLVVFECV